VGADLVICVLYTAAVACFPCVSWAFLLRYVNFDRKSDCGTPFSTYEFGANACNTGRVMAKNVIFNMAATAILDFVGYEF